MPETATEDRYEVTFEQILRRIDQHPVQNRYISPIEETQVIMNPNPDKAYIEKHYDIIHFNSDDVKVPSDFGPAKTQTESTIKVVPEVFKTAFRELDYANYLKIKDKRYFLETAVPVCQDCYLFYLDPNLRCFAAEPIIDFGKPKKLYDGYVRTNSQKLKYLNEVARRDRSDITSTTESGLQSTKKRAPC